MVTCFSCFKEFDNEYDICPFCGEVINNKPKEPIYLEPGTVLGDRYIIGHAVNQGGFGIIYKAWDKKLETIVAIKEFFVSSIMTRAVGHSEVIVSKKATEEFEYRKRRFLVEARTMAKFGSHRNIPNVFEFFEENGTAYIVMELLIGQSLKEFMDENGGKIDKDFAIMIVEEVGKALISMHENGIIHLDVAPDNIFICSGGELRIKLLDLGAAKIAGVEEEVIDIVMKPGYSPTEQYDKIQDIGVWSDIYSLGATLYIMLTGVKPDESTNRKTEDTVAYPHELDPSISENLSNSAMRAMAIDRHLRFKNVPEFLAAIKGERKVYSVVGEKKRRTRKRIITIAAACALLIIIGVVVFSYYQSKKAVQVLNDAVISVWFCADEGSDEELAVNAVIEDFKSVFPNVNIEVQAIPEASYWTELMTAESNGKLPTLFESSDLESTSEVLLAAGDVSAVLNSEQAASCLFLNQYKNYYSDTKKVPLGIEVPMAYVITNGYVYVDYDKDTFSSIADFGTGTLVAVDDDYTDLIEMNFDIKPTATKSQFMNNTKNECAVMLSSSMALNNVRNTITNFEKSYVYYDASKIYCKFTYEWSIGNGDKDEITAAERLLSWMLGNNYQDMLMVSYCADGQIPINEECFNSKLKQNNYSAIKKIYKNFVFEN